MAGMEGLLKTIKQSQIPGKQLRLHSAFAELAKSRSANKSDVARKTGISKARLSELTLKKSAILRAQELYDIAHAIGVNPCELLEFICGDGKKRLKS